MYQYFSFALCLVKWMGGGGEISDHVNNVLVREAIKEILGNFGHRQKMGEGGQWYSQTFYQSEVGKYVYPTLKGPNKTWFFREAIKKKKKTTKFWTYVQTAGR